MLEYVGLATSLEDLKVHPGLTTSYNVEVCDEHQAGVLHMSIPISRTMKRRLTHPGEMLREDFMPDYAITVAGLAEAFSPVASVPRRSGPEGRRVPDSVAPAGEGAD